MNQNLCKNLSGLRRGKNITNADIASITGISEEKLFKIEIGQEEPTFEELKKLANEKNLILMRLDLLVH